MTFYFLLFSILIDIIWALFWAGKWSHIPYDTEKTIHVIVLFTSWIGILAKIFVLSSVGLVEWVMIKSTLPEKLKEKLTGSKYDEQSDDI